MGNLKRGKLCFPKVWDLHIFLSWHTRLHVAEHWQTVCWKYLTTGFPGVMGEALLVMFVHFCGVRTPTRADFQLPTWNQEFGWGAHKQHSELVWAGMSWLQQFPSFRWECGHVQKPVDVTGVGLLGKERREERKDPVHWIFAHFSDQWCEWTFSAWEQLMMDVRFFDVVSWPSALTLWTTLGQTYLCYNLNGLLSAWG